MTERWSLSGDLTNTWVVAALALGVLAVVLLAVEVGRSQRRGARALVWLTGAVSVACLLAAVLRPVVIEEKRSSVGARVTLLLDASRSIDLPADGSSGNRREVLAAALAPLRERFAGVRTQVMTFGSGPPEPFEGSDAFSAPPQQASDLATALGAVARAVDQHPQALVVVSDGRLDRPQAERAAAQLRLALGDLAVPVHTVSLSEKTRPDASIINVSMAKAMVAHQPTPITVEIGCFGGLSCDELSVRAKELHLDGPPVERAAGKARVVDGRAKVDLELVLDRAGRRIVEVSIDTPDGDSIRDNNRRYLTLDVARDRVRLLHIAGRPTYDVRALRMWLKSDASVDVVAFFIMRTHSDKVGASQDELALIPFPVDELFTVHLPSFDAVILQDFDARPYGLSKHLRGLGRYVKQGGGLIMVGGPNAFVSGGYANSPLAEVLPVDLRGIEEDKSVDNASFVPQLTRAGRAAPVLEPLQALLKGQLPEMPGTNVVGGARRGATVLWEHPRRRLSKDVAMPVLALGEYGSGRSIALTVDGSHQLLFSTFAAEQAAGRAHGAFWDALLGWLMRDPRFEPAKVSLPRGCIAGQPTVMLLRAAFVEANTRAKLEVAAMGGGDKVFESEVTLAGGDQPTDVELSALGVGGYTATIRLLGDATAAPSRYDFACEVGGDEWADPRPDPARLQTIAEASGGRAVTVADIDQLPLPESADVVSERRLRQLLPPWGWTLLAALALGAHWIIRRRRGFA